MTYSKQATFNRVAKHLLLQRSKSESDDGDSCLLRTADGRRCAAGALVPLRDYDPEMEGRSGVDAEATNALCTYLLHKGHDLELVGSLQVLHDMTAVRGWATGLRKIARRHKLDNVVVGRFEHGSRKGGEA